MITIEDEGKRRRIRGRLEAVIRHALQLESQLHTFNRGRFECNWAGPVVKATLEIRPEEIKAQVSR
jgi:hypothetical protein